MQLCCDLLGSMNEFVCFLLVVAFHLKFLLYLLGQFCVVSFNLIYFAASFQFFWQFLFSERNLILHEVRRTRTLQWCKQKSKKI